MVGDNGFTDTVAPSRKIKWADFIEDYLWLIDGGVHPLQACEQIGIRPAAAERKLHRAGEHALARALATAQTGKGWDS